LKPQGRTIFRAIFSEESATTLATSDPIKDWSMTILKEKLIKIGAKVVRHGRYVAFKWPRSQFRKTCSPTSCG
jgi:hypothetical protein